MEIDLILIIGLVFLMFIFLFLVAASPTMINGDTYFYIFLASFFVTLIIIFVLIYQRSKKNGATLMQYFFGKGITSVCTSNGMCASNKCVNNFCVF